MAACGFYGKIPSEGDFVSRRLPWEFTSAWDECLQQGMHASRESLGTAWLALYLSAPIWRFQIAAGVCGPNAWRGLFFASVDRVGRYFPLTLAFAEPAALSSLAMSSLSADEAGWFAAEDVALLGLDPARGIDGFDACVRTLALPATTARTSMPPQIAICPVRVDGTAAAPCALFYTVGSPSFPPTAFSFGGLPLPAAFTEMIVSPGSPAIEGGACGAA